MTQALEAGHDVTILARDRVQGRGPNIRGCASLRATSTTARALAEAMRGQDAVISAIGRG